MIAPIRAGEARPGDLVVGQRVLSAVLGRVGHRDRRAVEEADAAAFPQPSRLRLRVQIPTHEPGHGGEEPLRQAFPGLAVGSGLRAAWLEPLRDTVRDQTSNRRAAGVIGTEHLVEEDPEGHQRREDPVVPGSLDFSHSLGDALRGEDLGKGEFAFLEELLAKEVDLTPKSSLGKVSHRSGSEPVMGCVSPSEPERRYLSIPLAVTEIAREI